MKTTLTILALAAVAASAPLPAVGQSQETLPPVEVSGKTVVVRYADLDTASASGLTTLHRRLNAATAQVCRYYAGRLEEVQVENRCRHRAKHNALAQFESNQARRMLMAAAGAETGSVRVSAH